MPFAASIFYEWSGLPEGPVLVFSNSLGTDLHLWDAQVASALASRFRLLRYDTRGHGRSPASAPPATLEALGSDLLSLLDTLHMEQAFICGISLGGMTALWLAINRPQRIRGIIAANTAARIGTAEGWTDRIAQVQRHGTASLVPATLARWFTPAFLTDHADTAHAIANTFAAISPAGYNACCAALRDADLRAAVSSIRLPTLIVAGTQDPVTPPSDAHFLARHIAGATCVHLEAAHLSNIEAADAFNHAVLTFLEAQPTGDPAPWTT